MRTLIDIFEAEEEPKLLDVIKDEIVRQHGSCYQYGKKFKIAESEISMFLNGKRPATFRQFRKHSQNLNLECKISLHIKR